VDEGEPTKELLSAVEGTKETLIALGAQRTLGLFPEVKDSGDLVLLAKRGRASPDETYIVAFLGGIKLLHKLPDTAEGDAMLSKIAQKGRPAIASANFWLK
jgi:hypothetical protein